MKEILQHKLEDVKSLEDKKLLKEMLHYVFSELITYNDETYHHVFRQVKEEIQTKTTPYPISIAVVRGKDYDETDGVYPVCPMDLEIKKYVLNESQSYLGSCFLAMKTKEIEQIIESGRLFYGTAKTKEAEYEIALRLHKADRYQNTIKKFYYDCVRNGIEWKTINSGYLNKFVDFELVSMVKKTETKDASMEVVSLQVRLDEYEKVRVDDLVPVWNIKRDKKDTNNYPLATGEHGHYAHEIILEGEEKKENIIVEMEEQTPSQVYISRIDNCIRVIYPKEYADNFPVYQIVPYKKEYDEIAYLPGMSNQNKPEFSALIVETNRKSIRTKAEFIRYLLSYEVSMEFSIQKIKVSEAMECDTYTMNPFIEDELHNKSDLIVFYTSSIDDNYTEDRMSFLLSELEAYVPEYHLIGVNEGSVQ